MTGSDPADRYLTRESPQSVSFKVWRPNEYTSLRPRRGAGVCFTEYVWFCFRMVIERG